MEPHRLRQWIVVTIITCLMPLHVACGLDLIQSYELALANDPTYQQATGIYAEQKEQAWQSLATLLPQLNATARIGRSHSKVFADNGADPTSNQETLQLTLDATQKLFDFSSFAQFQRSRYAVKAALMDNIAARQQLVLRVAQAYFNTLQQWELLQSSQAQVRSLKKQVDGIRTQLKHGHATQTSFDQALGNYQNFQVRLFSQQKRYQQAVEALSVIIGKTPRHIKALMNNYPTSSPAPSRMRTWVAHAHKHNLAVRAARYNVKAAQETIAGQHARHLPVLEAFAQYTRNRSPSLSTVQINTLENQESQAGLQLSMPLLSGGAIISSTRAAIGRFSQAKAIYSGAYLNATRDVKTAYRNVVIGKQEVAMARLSVKTNEKALAHTREGYVAGTTTTLDLIQQQNRLFQARLTLTNVRYQFLLNMLSLKFAVGTLHCQDLNTINHWLNRNILIEVSQ